MSLLQFVVVASLPATVVGHGYVIARTGPGSQQDYAARFRPNYPQKSGQEPQSSNSPDSWCGHSAYSTEKGVGWSWPTGGPLNPHSSNTAGWLAGSLKVGQEQGFQQVVDFNEDIHFEFIITAQHGGHHQLLAKCLDNPLDNDWVRLPRSTADEGLVNYSKLYPFYTLTPKSNGCTYNGKNYWGEGPAVTYLDNNGQRGSYPRYKARYYFPKENNGEIKAFNNGKACTHASIQWKWITANSCVSKEFCVPSWNETCESDEMKGRNWNDLSKCDTATTMGACGGYTDDKVAETFRNCIDMTVTSGGASAPDTRPTTTQTTAAPTTTEEVKTTIKTTTASPTTSAPETTSQELENHSTEDEEHDHYMPRLVESSNGEIQCVCEKAPIGFVGKWKCNRMTCDNWKSTTSTTTPPATEEQPAERYYDKAWNYNSQLGGHACACQIVTWKTQFTSSQSCADAWRQSGGCIDARQRVLRR